jgi:ubiquinone/menaquinone biosynthesis C-methylase UbiE
VTKNIDSRTVSGFGQEWAAFDQKALSDEERRQLFDVYFAIFPFDALPPNAEGFDLGCGSGRWAALMAPRVGLLHCIDPAEKALEVARSNVPGAAFHLADAGSIPLADASQDFGYSLGVLHHVPDTQEALNACVRKLKPGAPFLLYIYYALDNRPAWYRLLWRASDLLRRIICRFPFPPKKAITNAIALALYWPIARTSRHFGPGFPLYAYRNASIYRMKTDALDRFGTRLERRFTKAQIEAMMTRAGLTDIRFSDDIPYWTAVGVKRADAPRRPRRNAIPRGRRPSSART